MAVQELAREGVSTSGTWLINIISEGTLGPGDGLPGQA